MKFSPKKRLEQTGFVTGVPKPAAQAKRLELLEVFYGGQKNETS